MRIPILGFHCHNITQIQEGILENQLSRGEFYNFPLEDLASLRKALDEHNLFRTIHAPLIKPEWYPDPPTWSFLCDVEPEHRNLTFKMITETIDYAEEIGAEHIVVHFPIPCTDARDEPESELEDIAWKSCEMLAELSESAEPMIHIEGLGNSPYLNNGFLMRALKQYPLRYCFDTGHMNLAAHMNQFDLYEFAAEVAPFVGSVHLWNNRGPEDYLKFRHIPVHPHQNSAEGWADIERLLRILKPSYPVIIESPTRYPEALGDYDYRDGIRWIRDILEE